MNETNEVDTWKPPATLVPSRLHKKDEAVFFEPSADGARQAGDFVATAVHDAGMPWAADRAALAASLQTLWLARNRERDSEGNRVETGPITVVASYTSDNRILSVRAADRGLTLNTVEYQFLLTALAEHVGRPDAYPMDGGQGRVIATQFRVRRAFRERTLWYSEQSREPQYQYRDFNTEAEASAAARAAADAIGTVDNGFELSAVHVQGPKNEDSAWVRIESKAESGAAREPELPLDQLAMVVKSALRVCAYDWKKRGGKPPRTLPHLLRTEVDDFDPSEPAVRQIAQFVATATTLAGPKIRDPFLALIASTHSHETGPLAGLQHHLGAAYLICEERTVPSAPLDDPYAVAQELVSQLTVSGSFHLIARDPSTGQPRTSRELCGLGAAGSLLAECLLAGRLTIDPDTAILSSTGAGTNSRISQAALNLIALVVAEKPLPIGMWLEYLARTAGAEVESALLAAEILVPGAPDARRWRSHGPTVPLPADPGLVRRVVSRVTFPANAPEDRRIECAVLLALVHATGLDQADKSTWWMAQINGVTPLLERAGPEIPRLIGHVEAAVTSAVATGRR